MILWQVETGRAVVRLRNQEGTVYGLAWNPTGNFLASCGSAGTLVLRDLRGGPDVWRERACGRAGRNLSPIEWEKLLGADVPYRETCPEPSLRDSVHP